MARTAATRRLHDRGLRAQAAGSAAGTRAAEATRPAGARARTSLRIREMLTPRPRRPSFKRMTTLAYDFRHAVRGLLHMRRTAAVCILTLALGIGATTTMFSVVYAALIRPLPFEAADRLVMLYTTRATARAGLQRGRWAPREIQSLGVPDDARGGRVVYTRATVTVAVRPHGIVPRAIGRNRWTPRSSRRLYLRLLRTSPIAGRLFDDAERSATGAHPVAVIGEGRRRRFGSIPADRPRRAGELAAADHCGRDAGTFRGLSGGAEIGCPRRWRRCSPTATI